MVMAQATQPAIWTSCPRRAATFRPASGAETPLFQAFLRFSHHGSTDCHCIKDGTPIDESGTGDIAFMLARGFAAGMMHVVCSVVVGISFALLRKYESMSFFIIIGILASASTFHAIYNLLTTGGMAAHAVAYTLPALFIAIGYPLYIHFREKRGIA
jgi:hypothetical protein